MAVIGLRVAIFAWKLGLEIKGQVLQSRIAGCPLRAQREW